MNLRAIYIAVRKNLDSFKIVKLVLTALLFVTGLSFVPATSASATNTQVNVGSGQINIGPGVSSVNLGTIQHDCDAVKVRILNNLNPSLHIGNYVEIWADGIYVGRLNNVEDRIGDTDSDWVYYNQKIDLVLKMPFMSGASLGWGIGSCLENNNPVAPIAPVTTTTLAPPPYVQPQVNQPTVIRTPEQHLQVGPGLASTHLGTISTSECSSASIRIQNTFYPSTHPGNYVDIYSDGVFVGRMEGVEDFVRELDSALISYSEKIDLYLYMPAQQGASLFWGWGSCVGKTPIATTTTTKLPTTTTTVKQTTTSQPKATTKVTAKPTTATTVKKTTTTVKKSTTSKPKITTKVTAKPTTATTVKKTTTTVKKSTTAKPAVTTKATSKPATTVKVVQSVTKAPSTSSVTIPVPTAPTRTVPIVSVTVIETTSPTVSLPTQTITLPSTIETTVPQTTVPQITVPVATTTPIVSIAVNSNNGTPYNSIAGISIIRPYDCGGPDGPGGNFADMPQYTAAVYLPFTKEMCLSTVVSPKIVAHEMAHTWFSALYSEYEVDVAFQRFRATFAYNGINNWNLNQEMAAECVTLAMGLGVHYPDRPTVPKLSTADCSIPAVAEMTQQVVMRMCEGRTISTGCGGIGTMNEVLQDGMSQTASTEFDL